MTTTEKQNPAQPDSHPLAWGVEEIGRVMGEMLDRPTTY